MLDTTTMHKLYKNGLCFDYDNARDWSKYSPLENLYLNTLAMKKKYIIDEEQYNDFIDKTVDTLSSEILNALYTKKRKS